MYRLIVGAAMLALLCGCASPPKTAEQLAADGATRICKTEDVTGSHRPERTCHTKDEWTQIETDQREAARNTMQRAERKYTTNSMRDSGGLGN